MRSRRIVAAVAAAAALALLPAACARKAETPAGSSAGKPVIGLVFDVGGRGDKSFNDQAYAGLERAEKELGITFHTLETGEGADREAAMRQLPGSSSASASCSRTTSESSRSSSPTRSSRAWTTP
jgi:basic membrane lipoprotein Med (substrate-binding protein (PBP1-ABC) superfamily)